MSAAWNRLSLSARRAWIEIMGRDEKSFRGRVALRKESVDRNHVRSFTSKDKNVALRKESVDRNPYNQVNKGGRSVALRKESVDRNRLQKRTSRLLNSSLSARRAWIEML